jgi:hypothetical protein
LINDNLVIETEALKTRPPKSPEQRARRNRLVTSPGHLRMVMVATLLPRSMWYSAALGASRAETFAEPLIRYGKSKKGKTARLHVWIRELTRLGEFPIPIRLVGLELVIAAKAARRGILLCSTHFPLFDLLAPALVRAGYTPNLVVATAHNLNDGAGFRIPGASGTLAGVVAGPSALLRVRTKLREPRRAAR